MEIVYSLICIFVFFVRSKKRKLEKREKSSQGNVLKENQKNEKSPYKVMYQCPHNAVNVLTPISTLTALRGQIYKNQLKYKQKEQKGWILYVDVGKGKISDFYPLKSF